MPFAVLNGKKVFLEIADDVYSRELGLMFRESLLPNNGMIFIFEKPEKVNFWMKNMKIPLDLIFISDNKIAKIYSSVPACKTEDCPGYSSDNNIDYVIETNAGFCKKYGIKSGQIIKLDPIILNRVKNF